jgi:hypothetical protein
MKCRENIEKRIVFLIELFVEYREILDETS